MNDLIPLLHEAAEPHDRQPLDPHELLAAGKTRVRRRRALGAGGVTLAVVTVAAIAVGGALDRDTKADVAITPDDAGSYTATEISVAEVERRCTILLNLEWNTSKEWVAGHSKSKRGVSATVTGESIENREGKPATLIPEGAKWNGRGGSDCVIPQADLIEGVAAARLEPLPDPADEAAVADACARRTGFDIQGWDILAAGSMTYETGLRTVEVLAMATNGYVAGCRIYSSGQSSSVKVSEMPYRDATGQPVGDPSDGPFEPLGFGSINNVLAYLGVCTTPCVQAYVFQGLPDDYDLEYIDESHRVVATSSTNNGAVLAYLTNDARPTGVRLRDESGHIVWERTFPRLP